MDTSSHDNLHNTNPDAFTRATRSYLRERSSDNSGQALSLQMHPFHTNGSAKDTLRKRIKSLGIRGKMIAGKDGAELLPVTPPNCLRLFEFADTVLVEPINGRDQALNIAYFQACEPLLFYLLTQPGSFTNYYALHPERRVLSVEAVNPQGMNGCPEVVEWEWECHEDPIRGADIHMPIYIMEAFCSLLDPLTVITIAALAPQKFKLFGMAHIDGNARILADNIAVQCQKAPIVSISARYGIKEATPYHMLVQAPEASVKEIENRAHATCSSMTNT